MNTKTIIGLSLILAIAYCGAPPTCLACDSQPQPSALPTVPTHPIPVESLEIPDANQCIHAIRRWADNEGRNHETDCWNDKADNYIQIHRWVEHDGCVHEARQIVDYQGRVETAHFKKDINGHVAAVDGNLCVEQYLPADIPTPIPASTVPCSCP